MSPTPLILGYPPLYIHLTNGKDNRTSMIEHVNSQKNNKVQTLRIRKNVKKQRKHFSRKFKEKDKIKKKIRFNRSD